LTLLSPAFKEQVDAGPIAFAGQRRQRGYLPFALRIAGSTALFGLALWLASDGLDWRQLWALSADTLGYCLGLSLAVVVLLSWRWRLVAGCLVAGNLVAGNLVAGVSSTDQHRVPNPLWFARSMWIGLAVNQVTPSTAGGDILRAAMLAGKGLTGPQAAVSVIIDRVYGLAGLLVLCLVCTPMIGSELVSPALVSMALVSVAFIGAAIAFVGGSHLVTWLARVRESLRGAVNWRSAMVLVPASALAHAANIAIFLLIAHQIGLDLPVIATMGVMSAVLLFSVLPVTVAGWGLRELTLLQAFSGMDDGQNTVVLASVTYGLFVLAFHAFGFLFLSERSRL
jgi:glycosyltransferase 2 family protein